MALWCFGRVESSWGSMMTAHKREETRGGDGALVLRLGEHGKGEGAIGGRGRWEGAVSALKPTPA
jgi:hypothetical protein